MMVSWTSPASFRISKHFRVGSKCGVRKSNVKSARVTQICVSTYLIPNVSVHSWENASALSGPSVAFYVSLKGVKSTLISLGSTFGAKAAEVENFLRSRPDKITKLKLSNGTVSTAEDSYIVDPEVRSPEFANRFASIEKT